MKTTFEIIRGLREDHDLTQLEVAKHLHISQQFYSRYELGKVDLPSRHLVALADLYSVTTDYLLGRTPLKVYSSILNEEYLPGTSYADILDSLVELPENSKKFVMDFIILQKDNGK